MRMSCNHSDPLPFQPFELRDQVAGFDHRQLKNRPHRAAHRSPQEGAAGGFADEQSIDTKSQAVANQGAEIFRTGKAIDCGQQAIVAKAGEPFVCSLSDPSNPTVVYDTSITLDDLAKPTQLDVEVASSPRP